MKSLRLLLPLSLLLLLTTASAQSVCPCVPRENLWDVQTCDGFNCAMSALNTANGDPLTFGLDRGVVALRGHPTTPADLMAIAWAGEMLHIDFYSRGISLPHHSRPDFQEEWHRVAEELGYPSATHTDQVDEPMRGRPRIVIWR